MTKPFTSHVRAYRRRWGFTQDELAFLIGYKSRSVVSKLESSGKLPTVDIGFALYTVFGTHNTELFPSVLREVEAGVLARARELYERIQGTTTPMARAKLDFLEDLLASAEKQRNGQSEIV
jgi:transcriptional regulator with XRE-family HTH domain